MKPRVIVELAGPAGAGKSTVGEALRRRSPDVRFGAYPDIRAPKNIPFFAWNAFLLLPTFLALYRHKQDRFLTLREMTYLAILKGWHRNLRRQSGIIVLDQGPIYLLTELLRFGPQALLGQPARKWWEATCKTWAEHLDLIICLDAQDAALVKRIRGRDKEHSVKERSDPGAGEFLARSRAALEEVLSAMRSGGRGPRSFRFDTSRAPLEETINNVLACF